MVLTATRARNAVTPDSMSYIFITAFFLLNLVMVGRLMWSTVAVGIVPFEPVLEGENLTITCYTTSGLGARGVALVNEHGVLYSYVDMLDPANGTVGRINYGPVSTADNGKKFICQDALDASSSSPEVLAVIREFPYSSCVCVFRSNRVLPGSVVLFG